MTWPKITSERSPERPSAPMATYAPSPGSRRPRKRIAQKAMNGRRGMSQATDNIAAMRCEGARTRVSPFHDVDLVYLGGLQSAVGGEYEREPHGRLTGREGNDDQGENLSADRRGRDIAVERDQVDVGGIQH